MAEPLVLHQKINIPYRYTAGTHDEAFLRGLTERRIQGARCEDCGLVIVPARSLCPGCSARTGPPVEVADIGVLESWTTVRRDKGEVTYGLVRLDGADTPMLHLLDLGGSDPVPGMRLRVRWGSAADLEITAIECFEIP